MRNFILPLILFIFAAVCFAQPRKTDLELAGLKGNVHTVETAAVTETYDQNGDLIQTEIGPNCYIKSVFSRVAVMQKKMAEYVTDTSNSGYCTKWREKLPRENGELVYKLDYNDAYVSFQSPESYVWVHIVTTTIGDILLRRTSTYFDEYTRLKEEFSVTSNLDVNSVIYRYEGKSTVPYSAEFTNNNRFQHRDFYEFGDYDAQGNWTKAKTLRVEPESWSSGYPQESTRKITYY